MAQADPFPQLVDQQLEADLWPEPVRVLRVSPFGTQFELWAEGLRSQQTHKRIVDQQTLEQLSAQLTRRDTFAADAELFALGVEARRIALGYTFDPFFAVSSSRVDPLPHQLDAVYGTLLKKPRVRFLLADDPGAGKTIMAGLLLKELKYRSSVERVLVVTPANLTDQWRRELKDKFNERFTVLSSSNTRDSYDDNPWLLNHQVITSLDFAKQDRYRGQLEHTAWDLVIVDEAHKLSATRYGNQLSKSLRYRLGEVLANTSEQLLFLTATPHQGDDEKFRLLLDLLEPDLFATRELLEEAAASGENPIMLRRLKEDMTDFDGQRLFPARFVHTPAFALTSLERRLYQRVSSYVSKHFKKAWHSKKRNVGLAMTVLQRRLASSSYAIARSLDKRLKRLQALKEDVRKLDPDWLDVSEEDFEDDFEDMAEDARWGIEDALIERLTLAKNLPDLEREIRELQALSEEANLLASFDQDRKLEKLFDILSSLPEGEKLLVFTEHKDTLNYLLRILRKRHYHVTSIDGSMPLAARVAAEREFAADAQIMVATEAAGEGINLQFCALMVNYDLPWNPTRLEQRMGRIHRYGQEREVHIYNLVAQDTREGEVLGRLLVKLERMRDQLGSDRVYDVVGKLLGDINLERLLAEHLSGRKTLAEIHSLLDARLEPSRADYLRDITLEALAERHLDLSRLREQQQVSELQRLQPEYTERFFRLALVRLGGSISPRQDGCVRVHVPYDVRQTAAQPVPAEYAKATFDPKHHRDATLLAPGEPLFDTVRSITLAQAGSALQQGARFSLPHSHQRGLLAHLELAIIDGTGATVSRRLYACLQEDSIRHLPANVLVDALPYEDETNGNEANGNEQTDSQQGQRDVTREKDAVPETLNVEAHTDSQYTPDDTHDHRPVTDISSAKEALRAWAFTHLLEPFAAEVRTSRQREVTIKRKYGERSLRHLIAEASKKLTLLKLKSDQRDNSDMQLAILQEQRRLERLTHRLRDLQNTLKREERLSLVPPELFSLAHVFPLPPDTPADTPTNTNASAAARKKVEQAAMDTVMAYEKQHGRTPTDVSSQNLGYDIVSKDNQGNERCIEVKGRAGNDLSVILSANEWITASRLAAGYNLYVVSHALTQPTLHIIRDPAHRLASSEEHVVIQYRISADAIEQATMLRQEESSQDD